MPYANEFPFLYKVTNGMDQRLIVEVGDNLQYYEVDVRIDYGRWIQFQTEYGEWSRNDANNGSKDGNNGSKDGNNINRKSHFNI